MKKGTQIPQEISEAMLLVETGWSPKELDEQSDELIQLFLLYKAIKNVAENGGELNP